MRSHPAGRSSTSCGTDGAPSFRVVGSTASASTSRPVTGDPYLAGWETGGRALRSAWRDLDTWEGRADEHLGADLGAHLLVLWAVRTFAGGVEPLLAELIDDEGQPNFGDEVLEDIARLAFSLGASWSASLQRPSPGEPRSGGR